MLCEGPSRDITNNDCSDVGRCKDRPAELQETHRGRLRQNAINPELLADGVGRGPIRMSESVFPGACGLLLGDVAAD